MARRRITQVMVNALKAKPKRYTTQEDGLIVEINPSGKIVFFGAFYQHGAKHKVKLGDHPTITVAEARTLLLNIQHEIQVQDVTVKQTNLTVNQFIEGDFKDWCLANRKQGQETIDRLKHQIKGNRIGSTKLKDVTPMMLEAWKTKQLKDYEAATVVRNMGDLSRVFQLAAEWELIKRSPMSTVKRPKVDHEKVRLYLSDDELKRLHDALNEWDYLTNFGTPIERQHHPAYLPIIVRLAINTGMRRNEVMSLTWGDLQNGEIIIRGEVSKSGRTRRLPINDKLREALGHWAVASYPDDQDPSPEDRVFPVRSFRKAWSRLRKDAKLEHIVFHQLRHHFASTLVLKNTAISVVMDLMGHTDITTTQRYLSVRTEEKFRAVELL